MLGSAFERQCRADTIFLDFKMAEPNSVEIDKILDINLKEGRSRCVPTSSSQWGKVEFHHV
ncbi:hypothetical protein J6590_001180 [Homalodisca vitripennis]|nr:hypothetical protein J6590_001180 [Homalodisca vitripennis]